MSDTNFLFEILLSELLTVNTKEFKAMAKEIAEDKTNIVDFVIDMTICLICLETVGWQIAVCCSFVTIVC